MKIFAKAAQNGRGMKRPPQGADLSLPVGARIRILCAIDRLWQSLLHLPTWKWGLLLYALAVLVRLAFLFVFHSYRDLSRIELEKTAISLATTGVFGNPYAVPTGPTGHVAPGYTLLLAGIFHLFGTGIPAEIVKRVFASLVVSLLYALMPAAAKTFNIDRRAGILAGLIGALYPARPLVQIEGDWETPYTALALLLLSVITVRLWTQRGLSIRQAAWHGFYWGISLLFVPALLAMFAVFLAVGLYFWRAEGSGRYLRFAAVEVIVAAICLAPWVIRNYYALGSPVVTRTNFGLELRISNNNEASPDQRINYLNGLFEKYHPFLSQPEAMKVRRMGEVAYNKQAAQEAKDWIKTHPRRFLELCLGRARCFWFYYDPTSLGKTLFLWVTVALGFAGLVIVWRQQRTTGVVLALILIVYPLPNYLVHVGLRQEYPVHWIMTLLAAAAVVHWIYKLRPRELLTRVPASPRDTPARY